MKELYGYVLVINDEEVVTLFSDSSVGMYNEIDFTAIENLTWKDNIFIQSDLYTDILAEVKDLLDCKDTIKVVKVYTKAA